MNKIDLILNLVRENKITNEEAKKLMETEKIVVKEYVSTDKSTFKEYPKAPLSPFENPYTHKRKTTDPWFDGPYKITCDALGNYDLSRTQLIIN